MEFCGNSLWPNKKNAVAFPKITISHFAEEVAVPLNLEQKFIYNYKIHVRNHRITMIWV